MARDCIRNRCHTYSLYWAALQVPPVDICNVTYDLLEVDFYEPPIITVNYGFLYNWYAATDVRNLANTGWRVPTSTDFDNLTNYLGFSVAGGKLKETGLIYWDSPNDGATNEVGFNGRGAGDRNALDGLYVNSKIRCFFWVTDLVAGYYTSATLAYNNPYLGQASTAAGTANGHSIRLIKETTDLSHGETATYTGNDGKVYRTICIGTQEWLADNLCETQYRNNDWIPGYDGGVYTPIDNTTWIGLSTGALTAYNNDEGSM